MAKPKWLEEGSINELANDALGKLSELEPNTQTKRAIRALQEIIERTANGDEETVDGLLSTVVEKAQAAINLYEAEVEAIGVVPADDEDEVEEVDVDDEEEVEEDEIDLDSMSLKELRDFAKEEEIDIAGVKGKAAIIEAIVEALDGEEDEVEEEDDEEEIDLEELSLKELRGLAKEYGIATKGKKKPELIEEIAEAVEEDDEEEEEDEEGLDYESMSLKELKALAKSRGLKTPSKPRKPKLIELLEADDEE